MNPNKLTIKSQEILQIAQEIAASYSNQILEPEHLLAAIIQDSDNVASILMQKIGADLKILKMKTGELLERLPKVQSVGSQDVRASSTFSAVLDQAGKESAALKDEYISLEHLLLGLVSTQIAQLKRAPARQILLDQGVTKDSIYKALVSIRGKQRVTDQNPEDKFRALERFGRDLNELARKGKLDPVIGREDEIRRVMQVLSRRTKNNPVLIGEPGVGKTAIAEGIAIRIIQGDVPEGLKSRRIVALDLGALVAGTSYRGQFEERLKAVLKEVTDSSEEIILFIDELHTLVGTGAVQGSMDAANMLKPALAKGDLRAIGATTIDEYRKYIEKDPALERRFQPVMINEPSVDDTISILRGLKERYEVHHGVRITDNAIVAAAQLGERYIADRFMPDKAIDLIDEAASRMRLEIDSMPEELDTLERRIRQLEIEREAMKREKDEGSLKRLEELDRELAELREDQLLLRSHWEEERTLIQKIRTMKEEIEQSRQKAEEEERRGDYGKVAELRYGVLAQLDRDLQAATRQLAEVQKKQKMLKEEVDGEDVAEVVAKWTSIPVTRILESERMKLTNLEERIHQRMVNQEHAVQAVADAIRRSRAGLHDPKKPIGSFIFLGSTGVGKTELARALAEVLFNDEHALIRIDMSEYMEKFSVTRLIGAPPGYVGYEEGGQLTEAVRRKPYAVILIDEIEKAHPDTWNILLQVLDEGRLTDNKGKTINFRNTVILMTSNLGSHLIHDRIEQMTDENRAEIISELRMKLLELLRQTIRPEFLNRIDDIILFNPLTLDEILRIVEIQIRNFAQRLLEKGITVEITDDAKKLLAGIGYEPSYGARPLKRVLQKYVVNKAAEMVLHGMLGEGDILFIGLDRRGLIELQAKKATP